MSWLSQATGIHWGNLGKPIGTAIGTVAGGLLAPFTGGASLALGPSLGGALGNAVGGLGKTGDPSGHAVQSADQQYGIGGNLPGSTASGGIDPWNAILGAAGVIGSGAAAQKQGSLLNNALAAYNNNWQIGKNIRLAQHPVDLSQTFADPSNPFYSPSAGAVPTINPATGAPIASTPPGASPTSGILPGVPPLTVGAPGGGSTASQNPIASMQAKAALMRAAGGMGLQGTLGSLWKRTPASTTLPGVPPLNLGGPSTAVPTGVLPIQGQA